MGLDRLSLEKDRPQGRPRVSLGSEAPKLATLTFLITISLSYVWGPAPLLAVEHQASATKPTATAPATTPPPPAKAVALSNRWQLSSYAAFKQTLLTLMGRSRSSIWLASRALSDGDITSALYMARYRQPNLQIYLVLGKDELAPDSQYPQLQREHFPLAFAPAAFFSKAASYLMIDERLYLLDAPLSHLGAQRTYSLTLASSAELAQFVTQFRQPFLAGDYLPSSKDAGQAAASTATIKSDVTKYTKTYNYRKDYAPAPKDVARQLPKAPKWKKQGP